MSIFFLFQVDEAETGLLILSVTMNVPDADLTFSIFCFLAVGVFSSVSSVSSTLSLQPIRVR